MVRQLLLTVTVFMATTVWGTEQKLAGGVFYKTKEGNLVKRLAALTQPDAGESVLTLTFKQHALTSEKYFIHKDRTGRDVVTAVFKFNEDAKNKVLVLHGTYLSAKNKTIYYGDAYVGLQEQNDPNQQLQPGMLSNEQDWLRLKHRFHYSGGFRFSK